MSSCELWINDGFRYEIAQHAGLCWVPDLNVERHTERV